MSLIIFGHFMLAIHGNQGWSRYDQINTILKGGYNKFMYSIHVLIHYYKPLDILYLSSIVIKDGMYKYYKIHSVTHVYYNLFIASMYYATTLSHWIYYTCHLWL